MDTKEQHRVLYILTGVILRAYIYIIGYCISIDDSRHPDIYIYIYIYWFAYIIAANTSKKSGSTVPSAATQPHHQATQ